jgi:hypothetical protein
LAVHERSLGTIKTCAREVLNNIADHSSEKIGCVHIQHYPQKSELQITISDFGRGVPANIRAAFGQMSDGEAIEMATREGITTKSIPGNRGVGLSVLVDYVIGNGGRVDVYSLGGTLSCRPDGNGGTRKLVGAGKGSYPGTLVNITLRTDSFVGDEVAEEDQEFEW